MLIVPPGCADVDCSISNPHRFPSLSRFESLQFISANVSAKFAYALLCEQRVTGSSYYGGALPSVPVAITLDEVRPNVLPSSAHA
jgi:hypothetical protein